MQGWEAGLKIQTIPNFQNHLGVNSTSASWILCDLGPMTEQLKSLSFCLCKMGIIIVTTFINKYVFVYVYAAFISFFFFGGGSCVFLGPHPQHMEVPRLGVESELQLPAYTTAIITPDPRCICDRHHDSQQSRTLNPLSEGRDPTHNITVPSRIRFHGATTGTPFFIIFKVFSN